MTMREKLVHFLAEGSIWTTIHFLLTGLWLVMVPLMIVFKWWESIPFLAVISVYANIVGHWSAWQAARAEEQGEGPRRDP